MIIGARQGTMTGLRRLVAAAMAHDLSAFLIPGSDIAGAHGLDIEAAGLRLVASPRHASVLLVTGAIPPALRECAAVVYAQMMRPRLLFALGTEDLSPLPPADVVAELSQKDLVLGVRQIRSLFAKGAFNPEVSDFDAPVLQTRIEYTCPMHAEVVQDEPGSCPKCGMNLVPREAQASVGHKHTDHQKPAAAAAVQMTSAHDHTKHHDMGHGAMGHSGGEHGTPVEYTCPMHPEVVQDGPGSCPECGMNLVPRETPADESHQHHEHHDMDHSSGGHDAPVEYTCPMHPEVVQDGPGSCPECGMNLVPRETPADESHQHHEHHGMDHDAMAFMSMIDVTKDLPRSADGLPMEWIEAPFGPFFPGLPSGLLLTLTLDGDTVAGSDSRSLTGNVDLFLRPSMDITGFVEQLAGMDPLAPVAYRLLAELALENAAGIVANADTAKARIGALERERISSHLGWLALFGRQTGFAWLTRRAALLQLKIRRTDYEGVLALRPALRSLIRKLHRTPLLKSRTSGIGLLEPGDGLLGPVARASGINLDARAADKNFTDLGFTTTSRTEGDAFARLHLRLDEILHSLALIEAATIVALPTAPDIGDVSGKGEAVVETPRGRARLELTLEKGHIIEAQVETPSTPHLDLVETLTGQQALADALIAVGSLDLSPWGVPQ